MKNSETHVSRINKIRTGLVTAGVANELINEILKRFDALEPPVAAELAARTRFSVGTFEKLMNRGSAANPNPEGRRQMSRAIYFLDDLNRKQQGQALSPRSNDAFSALWKQSYATLANEVKKAAQSFTPLVVKPAPAARTAPEPQVVFEPPPDPPIQRMVTMPPPRKYVMSAEVRKLLEATMAAKHSAIKEDYHAKVAAAVSGPQEVRRMVTMPEPKRYVVTPEKTSMFQQLFDMRRSHLAFGLEPDTQPSMIAAQTAWGHAITSIQKHFIDELTARVASLNSLKTAAQGAYKEFESLYQDIGKEIQGNLSLAASLFSMLQSAPFPLSVAGQVGSSVVSQLHADTELPRTRELGGPVYFNNDLPLLVSLQTKLQAIQNWKDDVTRLGVPATDVTNEMGLNGAIDQVTRNSLEILRRVFDSALDDNFGDTPQRKIAMATKFHDAALADYLKSPQGAPSIPLQVHVVIRKISNLEAETKKAITAAVGAAKLVPSVEMQTFIELQLIADYFCKKFPKKKVEDFSGLVPEPIIRRLEGAPFHLVVRKSGKGQSQKIFSSGKIPWEAGHSNHVGALVFFFRWYRRNINPFNLALGANPDSFRTSMREYIQLLGAAIKDKSSKKLLGHQKTDWAAIERSV